MSDETTLVKLSGKELTYLRDSNLLPRSDSIGTDVAVAQPHAVRISKAAARKIGDALTERLAKVGFDKGYKLTREGQLLEALIDKFCRR